MNSLEKHEITIISIVFLFMMFSLILFNDDFGISPTGKVTSIINVSRGSAEWCNITLSPGGNQISLHCMNGFIPVNLLFNNISSELNYIYTYTKNNVDLWKVYNPNLPSYVINDLELISDKEGIWVFTKNYANIIYNGTKSNTNYIPLSLGWNLIGYPRNETKNTSDALASLGTNYDIILSYNATSGSFDTYTPFGVGNLTQITKERGYWIYMNTADTWDITW